MAGTAQRHKTKALVALAALVAASTPMLGRADAVRTRGIAMAQPSRWFALRGVAAALRRGGAGSVRVEVLLRAQPLAEAAAARRSALSPDPSAAERRALRGAATGYTNRFARREQAIRRAAIASLRSAALSVGDQQRPVVDAIRAAGGAVISGDPTLDTLTAIVPRRSLLRLATRPDVQAIEASEKRKPLDDLAGESTDLGATAWWAAGHTGGRGAADANPASLAIVGDPIYWPHPALAGITVEHPAGAAAETPNGSVHGTATTSVAVSQGAISCPLCQASDAAQKGIAPGVNEVLDTQGAYSDLAWAAGAPYRFFNNSENRWGTENGAPHPAQVLSYSFGGGNNLEDSGNAQAWDGTVDTYGVTAAVGAGNDGPTAQTINDPAIGYNVIAVGGFQGAGSADRSTDQVFGWSSRGPTVGGRKKPDLVAAGDADVADSNFQTDGTLWHYMTGTSFAAPQVAGAAMLLAGSGITDPKSVKAILLDSALPGRASTSSAMGTQTGWEPDWGWGELDLNTALAQRLNFAADSVPGNGVRFYRATAEAAGDRATLVWDRRVSLCASQGCAYQPNSGWRVFTLSNLALTELDPTTGAVLAVSNSARDNVQQVRAPASGNVVYKVSAGRVDGLSGEPFALAATHGLTALVTPQPTISLALSDTGVMRPGRPVTVTAQIADPSPDLTASGAHVTLDLPAGVSLTAGAQTVSLGTLGKHGSGTDSATVQWTVEGTSDGLKQLSATTSAAAYGSTLSSSASSSFTIDGTPPSVTLAVPSGSTSDPAISVSWGGSDPGAGVAGYDVDVSTDGGPLTPWLSQTAATNARYSGSVGHSYAFAVRATDRLANTSAWLTSAALTVVGGPVSTHPGPTNPKPPPAPHLRLSAIRESGRIIYLTGSIARAAHSGVRITWTVRVGRRTFRITKLARPARGRFRVALVVPSAARRATTATLTLSYGGDRRFARQLRRMTIRSV